MLEKFGSKNSYLFFLSDCHNSLDRGLDLPVSRTGASP
jgi:hypothetical protein